MELKRVDLLSRAHRRRRLQRAQRLRRRHVQQVVQGAVEPEKSRRVRAQAEIGPDGAHRRPDADSETDAMHHIVKVLQVSLVEAKTDRGYVRIDVSHVMEEYAADVVSNQREPQFGGMEKERAAADGEASQRISRTGLIIGKRSIRGSAAGIEPF